jgi:2-polyprenyl-3-methyl-5-hydroxy-6-metoxy-1,4-benzoquinol methylase
MTFARRLDPEWLDQLPGDDPRAIHTRRDLGRINTIMRNAACMASALRKNWRGAPPETIVDLGSGDGRLMLKVARRLAPSWSNVRVILQDKQNIVSAATRAGFAALRWHAEPVSADVFDFLARAQSSPTDIVTANLFLHHFPEPQLAKLLGAVSEFARLVVACEPRRNKFAVGMSRMLWAIGCNDVTIHDAVVSARAGFTGNELSAVWPHRDQWKLHEHFAAISSHCFVARRGSDAT